MTGKSFTFLFIRNDAHVRRFGLSRPGFVLLVAAAFLVISSAILGSYAGYLFWDRYRDLRVAHMDVRQKLDLQEERLQRLQNLEAFMRSFDPERLESILDTPGAQGITPDAWPQEEELSIASE